MIQARVISLLAGYVCGLFLAGYFLGKLNHRDITKEGSGNVGTTNATRVLGAKSGGLTLLCDVAKGLAAAGIVWLVYATRYPDDIRLLMSYATFGAMIGHMFPVYMGFRGGKGVATSLSFMALCVPQVMPLCILTFTLAVILTRYVSLGSILGTIVVVIELYAFGQMGWLFYSGQELNEVYILVTLAALIVILKHHENIRRLIKHEENPLTMGKSNK